MYGFDIFVVSENKRNEQKKISHNTNDNDNQTKNTIAINWNALDKWAPLAYRSSLHR